MTDYPEHEKLKEIKPLSQAIGEFLEWLGSQGMVICRHEASSTFYGYAPVRSNREQLLAEHFEINLDTLEAEKRQMLEELRHGG